MTETININAVCDAWIYAARLSDPPFYIGSMSISEKDIGRVRGMSMPRCVLPKDHHPFKTWPGGVCGRCSQSASSAIHAPGHMVSQTLFEPPVSPPTPMELAIQAAKRLVHAGEPWTRSEEYDAAWSDFLEKVENLP